MLRKIRDLLSSRPTRVALEAILWLAAIAAFFYVIWRPATH